MKIETLRSTDAGVHFYVETRGATFFHAGDLNDWTWEGAGDLINGRMRREYRTQIKKLAGKPINLAFVPMDPRQGADQELGMDYFLETTSAEYVFPMHMWRIIPTSRFIRIKYGIRGWRSVWWKSHMKIRFS